MKKKVVAVGWAAVWERSKKACKSCTGIVARQNVTGKRPKRPKRVDS